MTPIYLPRRKSWCSLITVLLLSISVFSISVFSISVLSISVFPIRACRASGATEWSEALQVLRRAGTGADSQAEAQHAWQAVTAGATADQIPKILAAMKEVGPLADNWLRAAVDTIAERQLQSQGSLPTGPLEDFVLDQNQPPRGRRIAYEWLTQVDATTPDRLLPRMLDDPSLELRYDAVEQLLAEAEAPSDSPTESNEVVQLRKYRQALRSARDSAQLRKCAEALKVLGHEPNMAEQMGFITAWKVIGPFDNTDRIGFDKVYPPESGVGDITDGAFNGAVAFGPNGDFDGKHGPVSWKDAVAEQVNLDQLGKVDLNKALVEEKSVVAYALATFFVANDLQVECRYETLEASKLWVNGEEVAANNIYHSGDSFDQYIVPCQFWRGENQILVKVCQNEQTESWTKPWDFRLRITDKLGGAVLPAAMPAK